MQSENFSDGANENAEISIKIRLAKQKQLASQVIENLEHLRIIALEFTAQPSRAVILRDWAAAHLHIQRNKYGLQDDELLKIGTNLSNEELYGLKMAGTETAARALLGQLNGATSQLTDNINSIFGIAPKENAIQLIEATQTTTSFIESLECYMELPEEAASIQPHNQVRIEIKKAKESSANKALATWLNLRNLETAALYRKESELLLSASKIIPIIDTAIEGILSERKISLNKTKISDTFFLKSICLYCFGIAREFSDWADCEDVPGWTLQASVASTACSLIRHGVVKSAVMYFMARFYDLLFSKNTSSSASEERALIHAGVSAMERVCQNKSNQLVDDFRTLSLLFADSES